MLQINVSPGPYTAGSSVSGSVELQGDGSRTFNVQTINITFSGRCRSKITESSEDSSTRHWGHVTLFQYRKTLFTGPYSMNASHEWPFDFIFPQCCQSSSLRQFKSTRDSFNDDHHQPLPPSFIYSTTSHFKAKIEASVHYDLKATLVPPAGSRGGMERTRLLTLLTHRREANPDPQIISSSQQYVVKSMYLSSEYQHRVPIFGEKVKAVISSSKLPTAHYVLTALLPAVGVLDQPMPLYLGVTYNEDHSTAGSEAPVSLRKVKVELRSKTTVRCVFGGVGESDDVHDSNNNTLVLAEQDFTDRNITLTDEFNVAELMDLKLEKPLAPLVPTFKTFNIIQTYGLRVSVTIDCGKKKSQQVFTTREFTVMAKDYDPSRGLDFATATAALESEDISAVPPSYEAAVKS
ncbi:MAG: hypothetical protein Q9169_002994 [Polycauliona sp. 2 TL-2023]